MALIQLPALDADNRAFWTHGLHGSLAICRCGACRRFIHPPLPICPDCGSSLVFPEPVSGRASVVSFSINYQPWVAGQAVPFVLAVVELVEQRGLWVMTNIVDCNPQLVRIGMSVMVRFEQHEDIWLPQFAPEATQ